VSLRRAEVCYDAVPVTDAENRTLFMSPVSRILVDTAEIVPCDGPFAPQFKLEGQWYRLDPHPTKVAPPQQLMPDSGTSVRAEVKSEISTAGLYTPEAMEAFSRFLTFPVARTAITNTLARTATGDESLADSSYDPTTLFSADHAAKLLQRGLGRLWSFFGVLGDFVSTVIGVLFFFKAFKYLANIALNALAIREASGCTFHIHILGAFWTALTQWIVVRQHRRTPAHPGQAHPSSPEHQPLTPVPLPGSSCPSPSVHTKSPRLT
jgi:hypothetical protein